ncbi:hypothetical protein GCM10007301_50060 [Azorhizobium oxalatiphilum]|uniref:Transmembrane protein n=1 Tax=Azorhizobium oxalatiphilum TaxID=980631 RepID=A0A917CDM9_9HYPH|nr:hypothetical protein [Azorhizobium oxalatiphilum]GGF84078.1 hypothetical protein GCM10007301_50060 [Azorhizobium oxalatiphilum]
MTSFSSLTSFRPGPRAMNWLIAATLLATGWAMYMRYMVIEPSVVGLACEGGLQTFQCQARKVVIALFGYSVFGSIAIVAAVLQFWRPNVITFGIALAFAGIGLVLYNNVAGAVAAMILLLSLARPGPATA